ncbi:23S rRNA (adenine(2503)-C(2))-methyltransferase RlmN [bacterium]|nr:23S rRNA (adenine(2503)-C(2))-methyltransferase RlmN [bacterium]
MDYVEIKNYGPAALEQLLVARGEKAFRARQLAQWIYRHGVTDFGSMTDLSLSFRSTLSKHFKVFRFAGYNRQASQDGSCKYYFQTDDGLVLESVSIPDEKKITFCLSTQVGCPLSCRFCLTGARGYIRDLSTAEIVEQYLVMREHEGLDYRRINVVLMGMGEPLLNYEAVSGFLGIALSDYGLGLSSRKITLSTAGYLPGLIRFSREWPTVQLAVSLNGSNNRIRSHIMPINDKFPLEELLDTLRRYQLPRRRTITIEYVLIAGLNDQDLHARELADLLRGLRCKINLIPYNPVPELPYHRPSEDRIERFSLILHHQHYTVMVRRSRGVDIGAACGQLGQRPGLNARQEQKRCVP